MAPISERLGRLKQGALDRVRGEPNIERLVADGMQLGEGTHIAHPIYFDRLHPWLITIGDHAVLAPYVSVITHDASLEGHTGLTRIGRVTIGKRVNVGVGVTLLPGTEIGEDSVIGANAVVHGKVPPGSLVVGNPAKISPIKPVAGWHRASAKKAPSWPHEGWTIDTGITEERKREQREALADGASGYIPGTPPPGSPHTLAESGDA